MFIRLALFTGLRLGELLGLCWEDLDMQSSLLHIRRTLKRLNKVKQPITPGEAAAEIVIQPPKSQNSIHSIPLLPAVVQDLINWKSIQRNDRVMAGDQYREAPIRFARCLKLTLFYGIPPPAESVVSTAKEGSRQISFRDLPFCRIPFRCLDFLF